MIAASLMKATLPAASPVIADVATLLVFCWMAVRFAIDWLLATSLCTVTFLCILNSLTVLEKERHRKAGHFFAFFLVGSSEVLDQ